VFNRLTIRDEYDLEQGRAADFCWQTALPCSIEGGSAVIQGVKGQAKLMPDAGCSLRIDDLPSVEGANQKRIAFRKEGAKGTIEVSVVFAVQ
jgi:hypothetical protein